MATPLFSELTEKDKAVAIENLIYQSSPRREFFLMVILAVLMATFGLLINSGSVIIGSMLVAPILFPVLGVSMGIVMVDQKLIKRSISTLLKSMGLGVMFSMLITLFSNGNFGITPEILARTEPSLAYLAISIIAWFAASFALINPRINTSLPGVAISVALIPPLAVVGIGLARGEWFIISSALMLFLLNIGGIIFASIVVFSTMNFYIRRKVAQISIAKDEEAILAAKEKAEQDKEEEKRKELEKMVRIQTQVEGNPNLRWDYLVNVEEKETLKMKEDFEISALKK